MGIHFPDPKNPGIYPEVKYWKLDKKWTKRFISLASYLMYIKMKYSEKKKYLPK